MNELINKNWTVSDQANAKPIGRGLSILEFKDNSGEWHNFDVVATPERIIFGGCCNVGFIESGYIQREDGETLDETLWALLVDLECYYNCGLQSVSRIVCNERM